MPGVRNLALGHFDKSLSALQKAHCLLLDYRPANGWVAGLRRALGMSERAFARRLRMSQPALQDLEKNERAGTVSLNSLRRAADALDADLVYALVPRRKLRDAIGARAFAVAEERMRSVARTMQLENQALTADQLRKQTEHLARELEARPNKLW
jgi:predicted DNA-binding mobile mystery protein A